MTDNLTSYFKRLYYSTCAGSLRRAAKEQRLDKLVARLEEIVPDIRDQYSMFKVDNGYLTTKIRNMHAFQIALVNKVIGEFTNPSIVDIGDSSGTHLQYILGLHSKDKYIKTLSVNSDDKAVERIRKKGFNAIKAMAEELTERDMDADILLCFETLEHFTDPCRFLHKLSSKTKAKYLVITVPYLRNSRVGLHHLRAQRKEMVGAENTHIFELSPEDWGLIIRHSGWRIKYDEIYLQYPAKDIFGLLRPVWRRFDFEGFYGAILERDDTWSSRYLSW